MSLQQEPELVLVEEPGQVLALAQVLARVLGQVRVREPGQVLALAQVPVGALIAVLAQGLGRA